MTFFALDAEPSDDSPHHAGDTVTVRRFTDPTEAQMARGMLESAGVACFLVGENVNNLLPAAFRVRLRVRAEDEAAALELLAETEPESED